MNFPFGWFRNRIVRRNLIELSPVIISGVTSRDDGGVGFIITRGSDQVNVVMYHGDTFKLYREIALSLEEKPI